MNSSSTINHVEGKPKYVQWKDNWRDVLRLRKSTVTYKLDSTGLALIHKASADSTVN